MKRPCVKEPSLSSQLTQSQEPSNVRSVLRRVRGKSFLESRSWKVLPGTPRYALTMLRGSRRPQRLAFYDTFEKGAKEAEETLTAFFT